MKLEGLTLSSSVKKTRTTLPSTSLSPVIQDLEKEGEKVEKYQDLTREIMRMWHLKSAEVIPIIVGTLGGVTRKLSNWFGKLGITLRTAFL